MMQDRKEKNGRRRLHWEKMSRSTAKGQGNCKGKRGEGRSDVETAEVTCLDFVQYFDLGNREIVGPKYRERDARMKL